MDVCRFVNYHFVHSPFPTMAVVEEREGSDVCLLSYKTLPHVEDLVIASHVFISGSWRI